jgi:hypothetical protein
MGPSISMLTPLHCALTSHRLHPAGYTVWPVFTAYWFSPPVGNTFLPALYFHSINRSPPRRSRSLLIRQVSRWSASRLFLSEFQKRSSSVRPVLSVLIPASSSTALAYERGPGRLPELFGAAANLDYPALPNSVVIPASRYRLFILIPKAIPNRRS